MFSKNDPHINRKGRPPRPEIEELRKALEQAKAFHNKSFIQSFVNKAYNDKTYAVELFKKLIPDLSKIDFDDEVKEMVIKWLDKK